MRNVAAAGLRDRSFLREIYATTTLVVNARPRRSAVRARATAHSGAPLYRAGGGKRRGDVRTSRPVDQSARAARRHWQPLSAPATQRNAFSFCAQVRRQQQATPAGRDVPTFHCGSVTAIDTHFVRFGLVLSRRSPLLFSAHRCSFQ